MARYNVDISSIGSGRFRAVCREVLVEIASADSEHDICHEMTRIGFKDGPVQFWRDGKPTLSHSSIHQMGKYRIKSGNSFPARVKRGEPMTQTFKDRVRGLTQTGET